LLYIRHIRLFEKIRIKKTKLITTLTFLVRCRVHKTIPCFLQFHHHIHSRTANTIYQHTSLDLLRETIHQNRRGLDITYQRLLNTHLSIANLLSESDLALIDQLTLIKAMRVGENSKARQIKKFTRLQTTQHPTTKTIKETVINHSDQKLDDTL